MRRALLIVFSLLVAACASEPEQVVPTEQHLQAQYTDAAGNGLRYLVWLPAGYGDDREKEHPMIVFLHGSGSPTYDSQFVLSFGLPAMLALDEQPAGFDFVVISPQAPAGSTWLAGDNLEQVDLIIQEALDTYLVDESRVYLTGLSMGGYASWHMGTRFPHRFAAMSSMSGSAFQLPFTPPPEYSCPLAQVPIWAFHGERDVIAQYRPVSLAVTEWAEQCRVEMLWTVYPDAGHFATYERAYRNPALYEWMLSHTRS